MQPNSPTARRAILAQASRCRLQLLPYWRTGSEAFYSGHIDTRRHGKGNLESNTDELIELINTLIDLLLLEPCHAFHLL